MTQTVIAPNPSASLASQTVVVIGGTSGIGLETARQAKAAGAALILTGRNRERLNSAAESVDARQTAIQDLGSSDGIEALFAGLPGRIDHVLVTGGGPAYGPIRELDLDVARRVLDKHLLGPLRVARAATPAMTQGGSLTFITGTGARRPGIGLAVAAIGTSAGPAVIANMALEFAPVRVNAIAAGFVDTPLSARLLGDQLDARRAELRELLPIGRVVVADDVAALAVHLMLNSAITGATVDIDGGQQLVP